MKRVNIHEAKTHLSRLIDAIERGLEKEIILARNGKPAARLVPAVSKEKRPLWGAAKDKWVIPEDFGALDPEIEKLFHGESEQR